jgi:uncharacterized cupredoxin-like copper-binding protein
MVGSSTNRRAVVLATVLAGVVLTGCASATHRARSPMMGGTTVSAASPPGTRAMGGGSGYHYSRLTCSAPVSLPGRIVRVTLADMGLTKVMGGTAPMGVHMMLRATPAAAPARKISLVASNMGWRTHELVVLPLAAGASAGQRLPGPDGKVDETASLGEASGSCASGARAGITAGSVGWTTLMLAPGRYELICNLANHYADGMHQPLVVT